MAEQSRASKFLNDLGIYTLANLSSRVLTFLMVPVYTYFVERPADFGYYDMCMIICSMLYPVVSLRLRDSAVRFLLETNDNDVQKRTLVVTSIVRVLFRSLATWALIVVGIRFVYGEIPYLWYSLLFLLANSMAGVMTQFARGFGMNKLFAAVGVVTTFLNIAFTIVLLVVCKMGIEGIFISNIAARFAAVIITEYYTSFIRKFFSWHIDIKAISREVLKFCVPLIPTALCWSLTAANGRFFIGYFLGLSFNGIFAVALRFGSVFDSLSYIFGTAWQETAIRQYGKEGSNQFFSKILTAYIMVLCLILITGSFLFKAFFTFFIAENYRDSINYVYLIGFSASLYALAAFFELGYQCAKETVRTIIPIIITALINVAANVCLIQFIGLYGICVSSCLTYGFLLVYRWIDTKRYFTLSVQRAAFIPVVLAFASILIYYLPLPMWANIAYAIGTFIIIGALMPKDARQLVLSKLRLRKH